MARNPTLLLVHLTSTYPEVLDRIGDPEDALGYLMTWTAGDWRRVGKRNADQVTHVGGVFQNRLVSLYEVNGYSVDDEGRYRFQQPTPAADRYHTLIGETYRWRQGYAAGWMPPRPIGPAKPYPPSSSGVTVTDAMLGLAQRMVIERTLGLVDGVSVDESDPLLASVTIARNPRGGIIVEVPSGTNVLIKQV